MNDTRAGQAVTVFGLYLGIWALVFPSVTFGQASTSTSTQGSNESTLEDVVVTARRRSESAQQVPVALSALTGADIQKSQIFDAADLTMHVPALIVASDITGGDAQPIFTVRGLGQEFGTEPTVLVYFADAPAETRLVGNALYDMSTIQVLRGPQGTLFGKNAIGGAVLLEPQAPTHEEDGFLQARFGNFDTRDYTGMYNLPLNDWAALRFAGESIRADGWLNNIDGPSLNNKHRDSGRASLLLNPTDWLENTTVLQYFDLDQRATGGELTAYTPCPAFKGNCFYSPPLTTTIGAPSIAAALLLQQQLGPRTVALTDPGLDHIIDRRIADTTSVNLESLTLKNIASFSSASVTTDKNLTGTNVPIFLVNQIEGISNVSDELQLQGKALGDQIKWITGAFFSKEVDGDDDISNTFVSPLNAGNPTNHLSIDGYISKALFAQTTIGFDPWVPGLDFTGGFRRTWDERTESLHSTIGASAACALKYPAGTPLAGQFYPGVDANCTRQSELDFSANGYTYGFNYKLNESVMLYVSRNRAYKAGGFNTLVVEPQLVSYQPEYIVDTELGIKSDWHLWNRPLRVNLALYDSNFTNIQIEDVNVDPISHTEQSFVFNGSKATMRGGELELTYRPIDDLELQSTYTYDHGVYGTLISLATGSPVLLSGVPFSFLPRSTYRFSADYRLPFSLAGSQDSLSADYYHQDSVPGYASHPPGPLNETAPYGIANARFNMRGIASQPLDISLYVKNLQNRVYQVFALDDRAVLGYASDAYGEPRTYGVTLDWRFGAGARQ